VKFSD